MRIFKREGCGWHLWGAAADLCLTPSGRSPRGSPGCPCGPSPREPAAEPAASAGAAALVLKSPAGADSSGPSLQVSEEQEKEEHTPTFITSDCESSFCYYKHINSPQKCVLIIFLLCSAEAGWVKPQWILIGMISFALEGLPVVQPPAPVMQLRNRTYANRKER